MEDIYFPVNIIKIFKLIIKTSLLNMGGPNSRLEKAAANVAESLFSA